MSAIDDQSHGDIASEDGCNRGKVVDFWQNAQQIQEEAADFVGRKRCNRIIERSGMGGGVAFLNLQRECGVVEEN